MGLDLTAAEVAARERSRHRVGGVWLVLLAASMFGVMPVLAQVVYDSGTDVYSFLALRFGIAAAILWVWVLARGHPLLPRRLLLQVVAIGGVIYVSQSLTFFTSIRYADVSIVASLAYTYPIMLMLLAALTGRERIVPLNVVASLGAVTGAVLLVGGGGHADVLGIVLVLTANAIYAGYLVISERVIPPGYATGAGVVIVTSAAAAYAAIVALGPHLQAPSSTDGWLALLAVTIGPTVIGMTALIAGLQRLKPVATGSIGATEPVVAVALSVVVLKESVTVVQIAGLALVVASVVAVTRSVASAAPAVDPAAHR